MLGSAIMRQWSGGKASKTVNGEPANQAIARYMPACLERQRWFLVVNGRRVHAATFPCIVGSQLSSGSLYFALIRLLNT